MICETDFSAVIYTLRFFFFFVDFTVALIVSLTVLVQNYDLPCQMFCWYENFAELIIHSVYLQSCNWLKFYASHLIKV